MPRRAEQRSIVSLPCTAEERAILAELVLVHRCTSAPNLLRALVARAAAAAGFDRETAFAELPRQGRPRRQA